MTKVITRFFDSAEDARAVKAELVRIHRLSPDIAKVYDSADGLADTLTAGNVAADTAKAYAARMAGEGGAVLMVRAGFKPLNVAKTTREVIASHNAVDMGGLTEETYVKEPLPAGRSVLAGHPHILYKKRDPDLYEYRMADWPIPLISRRQPADNFAFPRHARMASWPIPLLSDRKPYDNFAFPRHARMAAFPIPLISRRQPKDRFAFPRHARMAAFPIPLISRRKPYTGSIIAKHARMANWPFPHLMNGKRHTNSLMPGAPRMANWPIRLISRRQPKDRFAFPRHARMAAFPIPLTSRRKPFTGSIIGKHARMADMFLPLVIRREEGAASGSGFSLSKLLGLKTVIRRDRAGPSA